VGCREEELIGADEPWTPSRFEFRDWVRCRTDRAGGGTAQAREFPAWLVAGSPGERAG